MTPGADTDTPGFEAQLFSGPWSFLAERYQRKSELPGGASSVDDDGDTLQRA